MSNTPLRTAKITKDGKITKQHSQELHYGFNPTSTGPNRKQRRYWLQKQTRNPFYGITMTKSVQVVSETQKSEEGIVQKLGRILSNKKRNIVYTGKVKVIDHKAIARYKAIR